MNIKVSTMSVSIRPHSSTLSSSPYSPARHQVAGYFSPAIEKNEPRYTHEKQTGVAQTCSPAETKNLNYIQFYQKLIEVVVRQLIREGLTFIEAYDQVLAVGRLNPSISANQLSLNNPSVDQKSFLEFKAYNACIRLKRRYTRILAPFNL
jgi:hypothetical protein